MEVGFSCMGHEIPAASGSAWRARRAGEVYVVIGDGTYLMGNTELVTAVQEGLKITVIVVENGGYQSIHALQRSKHRAQLRPRVPRPDRGRASPAVTSRSTTPPTRPAGLRRLPRRAIPSSWPARSTPRAPSRARR